jgi:hypothetical protein
MPEITGGNKVMKIVNKIEWLCPGAFMPEEFHATIETRNLDLLEIPKDVYAFRFYDVKTVDAVDEEGKKHEINETINKSPRHIIGKAYTMDMLKMMNDATKDKYRPRGKFDILMSNVDQYDSHSAILTPLGNWQPMLNDDIVLDPEKLKYTKPLYYKEDE